MNTESAANLVVLYQNRVHPIPASYRAIVKSLKSVQIVKKYRGKIKRDQKAVSKFAASSLLKTGTKE